MSPVPSSISLFKILSTVKFRREVKNLVPSQKCYVVMAMGFKFWSLWFPSHVLSLVLLPLAGGSAEVSSCCPDLGSKDKHLSRKTREHSSLPSSYFPPSCNIYYLLCGTHYSRIWGITDPCCSNQSNVQDS